MSRRHSLPAEVYALVDRTPGSVLLECGKTNHTQLNVESCSRIFVDPVRVLAPNNAAELASMFGAIEDAVAAGEFAAGFFTYECSACFEPKAAVGVRGSSTSRSLAWFGIYEHCYRFDHATGTFPDGEPPALAQFRKDEIVADKLCGESHVQVGLSLSCDEYAARISAIHEWIRAGDVYQLNYTMPYTVRVRGSIAALYERLTVRQPVEYGAFLHWQKERKVLSFSPELFFRVEQEGASRRIVTRPMKGTAARGRTTREDNERAEWLQNDAKNRSENVMIVDLLRNDLGRIAAFGSVHAESLFTVERYPTLWQMTSTVTAELRPEVSFDEIFRALFPCGSITGAPKFRAMQLIGELEEQPRGVYTGAIGFFSRERTVFNVAIRTLELEHDRGTMGVGSGIVIDSDAVEEYDECLLKAEFLTGSRHRSAQWITPAEKFLLIETMLWNGGYPLLDLHLDRLVDSAEYFGIPLVREGVRAALEEYAEKFTNTAARKVRLLADGEGALTLAQEVLVPAPAGHLGRVRIAGERTDPMDRWLYHKTTNRAVYSLAHLQASEAGYDDVLFLNLREEVTEGAISNVFIEKDGRLFTPPVECGMLAGVYRRHLLETRSDVEEKVLTLDNLRSADAIYLCNALRGLRRVTVDW
jgi:para-aminobenzoate synthetase/4-amino-4-deoxychorismate lyase